jgi:hypothetical protein
LEEQTSANSRHYLVDDDLSKGGRGREQDVQAVSNGHECDANVDDLEIPASGVN